MRLYHFSHKRMRKGDVINRGDYGVFMSDSPIPHCTVIPHRNGDSGHVYEVSPLGKVNIGTLYKEYYCKAGAEIIKYVGTGAGILKSKRHNNIYLGSYCKIPFSIRKWKQKGR